MDSVQFKLPHEMVIRLEQIAGEEDISLGQVIRLAVERDFRRRDDFARHTRLPQRLIAPIRERVQGDFLAAEGWSDLKARLVAQGYALREAGGGLALHESVSGRFLCRTSELGFGYPALLRRFASPFPGHSHTWLLDRIRDVPVYVKT